MQGFSLNNISDCQVGSAKASAIYFGDLIVWQRQQYTWVTLPQYAANLFGNNIPNSAYMTSINANSCHLTMPTYFDFTYVLDPDTSTINDNLNLLYYDFDITGVDNIDISLTTNLIPSSACNLFKTNRTTQVTSDVSNIQSGMYTFEKNSTPIGSGFLSNSDTWTYNSSSLDPRATYHFSLFYSIDERDREYDYFYQANNVGPGIEVYITTTTN